MMIDDETERWGFLDLRDLARSQGRLAILRLRLGAEAEAPAVSSLCDIGAFLARYARPLPSEEELAAMDPLSRVDAVKTARTPTARGMIGIGAETTPGFSGGVAERDMARACAAAIRSLGGKGGTLAARAGPGLRTWTVLQEPIERMVMSLVWRDPDYAEISLEAAMDEWLKGAGAWEIQRDPPPLVRWDPELKARVLARLQSADLEELPEPAAPDRPAARRGV